MTLFEYFQIPTKYFNVKRSQAHKKNPNSRSSFQNFSGKPSIAGDRILHKKKLLHLQRYKKISITYLHFIWGCEWHFSLLFVITFTPIPILICRLYSRRSRGRCRSLLWRRHLIYTRCVPTLPHSVLGLRRFQFSLNTIYLIEYRE